jgi:hypothetical protein
VNCCLSQTPKGTNYCLYYFKQIYCVSSSSETMGGARKKGKAAARSKAAPAPADDPCAAYTAAIGQLIQCSSSGLLDSPLWGKVYDLYEPMHQFLDKETDTGWLQRSSLRNDAQQKALMVTAALAELLVKVLAVRKLPSDWQQEQYSTTVENVLAAVNWIFSRPVVRRAGMLYDVYKPAREPVLLQLPTALGNVSRTDLLAQISAAQEEVCHLLKEALQQQQQQQPEAEQHSHLCSVAVQLQAFGLALESRCSSADDPGVRRPSKTLAMQQTGLELAAVLMQTLTADSSRQQQG